MKKKFFIFSLLFFLFSIIPVFLISGTTYAAQAPSPESDFVFDSSTGTITGHNPSLGVNVVIPSTIGGTPVTSIGFDAFLNCSSLTSVTIPNGVTSIGVGAFKDCSQLASVTIQAGGQSQSIGDEAFCGCTGLSSVIIPSGVTSIGEGAFMHCNNLANATIQNGVTSIGHYALMHPSNQCNNTKQCNFNRI